MILDVVLHLKLLLCPTQLCLHIMHHTGYLLPVLKHFHLENSSRSETLCFMGYQVFHSSATLPTSKKMLDSANNHRVNIRFQSATLLCLMSRYITWKDHPDQRNFFQNFVANAEHSIKSVILLTSSCCLPLVIFTQLCMSANCGSIRTTAIHYSAAIAALLLLVVKSPPRQFALVIKE